MNDVVEFYNDEERAGTFLIAKGFQKEPFRIKTLVDKYKDRFLRLENNKHLLTELIIRKVSTKKAGRPIEEYLLNEGQTIFLGTLFRNSTDIVLDFKEQLAREFVNLKFQNEALKKHKTEPEYKLVRNTSKIIRLGTTDIIQEFVKYSQKQGSKHADYYYSNITKMVNGLLFIVEGKFKNLREVMTTQQLMTISSAEQIINKGLSDGMKSKMFYKDIYKLIKGRVFQFAKLHGKTEVIDRYLKLQHE